MQDMRVSDAPSRQLSRHGLLWLLACCAACVLLLCGSFVFGWTRSVTSDHLIEARESAYNSIYMYARDGLIRMTFGHNERRFVQSWCGIQPHARAIAPQSEKDQG